MRHFILLHLPATPALGNQRQEDGKSEASLGHKGRFEASMDETVYQDPVWRKQTFFRGVKLLTQNMPIRQPRVLSYNKICICDGVPWRTTDEGWLLTAEMARQWQPFKPEVPPNIWTQRSGNRKEAAEPVSLRVMYEVVKHWGEYVRHIRSKQHQVE